MVNVVVFIWSVFSDKKAGDRGLLALCYVFEARTVTGQLVCHV